MHLALDVIGKAVGLGRVHFLDLLLEIVRILDRDEVVPSRNQVELHGVEIGSLHLVSPDASVSTAVRNIAPLKL